MVMLPGLVVPTAEIPIAAEVVLVEVSAALVAEETTVPAVEPVWLENHL
jgi:energy-converting hydrogenase Eha subunit G